MATTPRTKHADSDSLGIHARRAARPLIAEAALARAESGRTKNSAQQRGTMTFRGVATNDPSRIRHRLWIFDELSRSCRAACASTCGVREPCTPFFRVRRNFTP
jgi:hypothetical protein